jgi:hypothetical protein
LCWYCKQNKSGQYWYNKTEGKGRIKPVSRIKGFYSKFCSEECINKWRQDNLVGSENINDSGTICHHCHSPFSGQHWTTYDERKKTTYKFCSQSCCDDFCNEYNQVVIAWNNLILERKNLTVPNFPTWEELEIKQENGELENFVEETKKKISEVRNSSLPANGNGEKMESEIITPINPFAENKAKEPNLPNLDKTHTHTQRERERERERERAKSQQSHLRTRIQQLEQKPSKTPQEEAELVAKRQQLAELEKKLRELERKNQEQKPKNKSWGLIIGGTVVGVVGLVGLIVVIVKRNKSKK